ncbi:response regulator transcription factor [Campylobacter sp. faydin G-140]|uniref:winged helix-turn-helix domain-containing protein n=1 Tax=Campylobacter anatolicus TaxID=2829105 RepID=UPI001B9A1F4C|nr:winged helix-turn-helix domain-containing protein [Campylobacter anatolicus]MBR8466112.1 response regulator transcription factor [Campylobacter anatolicus]
MKKIMLLSSDTELNLNLSAALWRFNFRITNFKSESEVFADFDSGNRYDLYVLETRAKNPNLALVKFLRENKNITPILMILDEAFPPIFKKIYYARVDGFIVKPFSHEEFTFHALKLCKVLFDSRFELKNGLTFEKDELCINSKNGKIYIGKKEGLFLEILAKNSPHVVTYDEIEHHLYKDDSLTAQDRLRSLLRELRKKVPNLEITTIRGVGYKLE